MAEKKNFNHHFADLMELEMKHKPGTAAIQLSLPVVVLWIISEIAQSWPNAMNKSNV